MPRAFPAKFVFGAATAAFQCEGATQIDGRGPCYWDEYFSRPTSTFNADIASDFYHKYKEDVSLCREFGINGIRISLAWTRVMPNGKGLVNQKGIDYYHRLIDECIENGVEPFVTLHHFDTPLPLFKKGDWLNNENIDHFAAYAKICFEHFGDKVKKWITINEPYSVVAGQYIIGHFPPNIKYDIPKAVQAMHNMMVAHSKVVNLYKTMNLLGEIGIVHILEGKYPITDTPANRRAAEFDDTIANSFMLDACLGGEYRQRTLGNIQSILSNYHAKLEVKDDDMNEINSASKQLDFLGINYYASHFVEHHDGESGIVHNGTGKKGSSIFCLKDIGKRVKNPAVPTTDWDWAIYPQGLYEMLVRVKREYPNYHKIYITENGMGAKEILEHDTVLDDARIDYIAEHLNAILDAVDAGVNVEGYFLWSLMDVFSWTNGFTKRYGLFYVDFETQKRYAKKSASWFKALSAQKEL
ncbi:MAG: 6-phospho-beta-galactosidase [Firmicutes bacterium]|nr:6-phospho-beta-galactosidase [Bacillota bacterium]